MALILLRHYTFFIFSPYFLYLQNVTCWSFFDGTCTSQCTPKIWTKTRHFWKLRVYLLVQDASFLVFINPSCRSLTGQNTLRKGGKAECGFESRCCKMYFFFLGELKWESCVSGGPFEGNIVFKTQVCITQDMSTIWRKNFLFMHSGLRCYFIPKMGLTLGPAQRPH